jgi:hypothetical protein
MTRSLPVKTKTFAVKATPEPVLFQISSTFIGFSGARQTSIL